MSDRNELVDVEIVYAHDPDTDGPDLARVGQVEQHPRHEARVLVASGAARWPAGSPEAPDLDTLSRAELVGQARARGIAVERGATPAEVRALVRAATAAEQAGAHAGEHADLEAMTIHKLRDTYPAAADMPAGTHKADLIAAIEDDTDTGDVDTADGGDVSGAPKVTVAPGAEHNPNSSITGRPVHP